MSKIYLRPSLMRSTASLAALAAIFWSAAAMAQSPEYDFDIRAESLSSALTDVGRLTGQQIIYTEALVAGRKTDPLHAHLTADVAVQRLLAGTGLVLAHSSAGGLEVRPKNVQAAQVDGAASGQVVGQGLDLESVLVTAEKKSERLQDAPVPVTEIDASQLTSSGEYRIQDFYSMVPGLSIQPEGTRGAPILTIRGISAGDFANPTVGITVDDVPFGSSTFIGGGYVTPDLDPSDLKDIQVLRGPQGTLYGVASIGGLLKYETADPTTDSFFGYAKSGVSAVTNGSGAGYNLAGGVNVPISDTIAIRASAFTREDPGYINDPQSGQNSINTINAQGGHVAMLWTPFSGFSLKLSALVQHSETDGSTFSEVTPGSGDFQYNSMPGTGGYKKTIQAYSAIAHLDLGFMDLTSVTGYGFNTANYAIDYSTVLGGYAAAHYNESGVLFQNPLRTRKISEELRASGTLFSNVDWLLGGFYTFENSHYNSVLSVANLSTGALLQSPTAVLLNFDNPSTYQQYAIFGDLTYHVTERFDIQVGGREAFEKEGSASTTTGVFGGPPSPLAQSSDDAFTYLVTPEFKVSPDVMIYARLSTGFRAGGPNANSTFLGVPAGYNPDMTKDYDLGTKGTLFDGYLTYDASAYDIEWSAIQLTLAAPNNPGSVYIGNGNKARSQGVELAAQVKPTAGLTLGGWFAANDAKLTQAVNTPSLVAADNARLPYTSPISGNITIDDEFKISDDVTGSAGLTASFIGNRATGFLSTLTTPRGDLPAYSKFDLRAAVKYDFWTANFYVNNVSDERGLLAGPPDTFPSTAVDYIQPRTFGMTITRTF